MYKFQKMIAVLTSLNRIFFFFKKGLISILQKGPHV